jgi:hypothetical protein
VSHDEILRRLRRERRENPDDPVLRDRYIAELERVVGLEPRKMLRVELTDRSVPCLICEKPVELEHYEGHEPTAADIVNSNFYNGAHVRGFQCWSSGNYGCQVLDMGGTINFVLCDGCLIRHSSKMIYEDHRDRDAFMHAAFPVVNARDYYEDWLQRLKESHAEEPNGRRGPGERYMRDVSPHFED